MQIRYFLVTVSGLKFTKFCRRTLERPCFMILITSLSACR